VPGYRDSHRARRQVDAYEAEFRTPGTPDEILWHLEQRILPRLLADLPVPTRVLDFAAGTGRISELLERTFPEASVHGVDVSPEMLEKARERCTDVSFVEGDITRDDDLLHGPYDLVTAFRFFLRAEPALRHDALGAIRGRLSPSGRLVANFHRNPTSVRGLWLRVRPGQRRLPFLSLAEVERLLWAGGFAVERTVGYQHCFYRSHPRGPVVLRRRLDERLADAGALPSLALSFVVVARPR
jgi:SAM-dependent methyltransferase